MDESYVFFNEKIVPEKEVSISIRSKVVNYALIPSKQASP